MIGFPSYERVKAEIGQDNLFQIFQALVRLLPCPTCGASVGRTCVTIDDGVPTHNDHIARQRSGGALKQIWIRMANEAFEQIDSREIECLKKLIIK